MLMMLPAFLMVLYPAAKLVQRRRDPGRLIWREMGSVYTGRFDRLLIVGAIVVIALMWLGAVPTRHSGMVHPDYAPIRLGWILATMLGWGVATVAMIVDQGVAFFDLRIANTYAKRYRRPTRRTGP
jgi:hypothetical protein